MALKRYKPITPGTRFRTGYNFVEITKTEPEKSLLEKHKKTGGRNSHGRITSRRRGGGHKRKYRIIDFRRDKEGIPAKVIAIEYDPNRTARIALLQYVDGEKRYILAPLGLDVGQKLLTGPEAEILPGNCLKLKDIPLGTMIHNVEYHPGRGGKVVRSAGTAARLMTKEGNWALLEMPSGEVRRFNIECKATIGQLSNPDHIGMSIGKAGRKRWLGRRPKVRGVAMNPIDHPMGGGEGRSSGGRHPCSPWGKPAKGGKTRRKKPSDKYIVRGRKSKKRE